MPTTYAIPNGRTVMDVTTWTGTSTASGRTFTGLQFQPDFVWSKTRNQAYNHQLYDSNRGTGKRLASNTTDAETTNPINGYISAFNSNGFTTIAGSSDNSWFNETSTTYVGWQWQAGQGVTSSNTSGSITSTVSVNQTAGFSVVTYTGTGSNATVGHGLGVAPKFILIKRRDPTGGFWIVYTSAVSSPATSYLYLNTDNAVGTGYGGYWNSTSPTSSVISLGTDQSVNQSTATYVAYCWSEIAGFSQFGSYTGNGSADGPFVYTGFRPKFILIKGSSFVSNWFIEDGVRNGYNVNDGVALRPNLSGAEDGTTTYNLDILSNGFKLRTSSADSNTSGATFIYAAFAENPFKYANAR